MIPIALEPPAVEPVSPAEMKAFLRIDGDAEDELIAALLGAARLTLEGATRLAFVAQTWRLALDRWPRDRSVPIPLAPVLGIAALAVMGTPLDPALYRLDDNDPARLLVDMNAPDPVRPGAITIDVIVGFGADPAAVPVPLRLAIRRLAARWYEARGDGDAAGGPLDADIAALVAPYRRPRLV